MSTNKRKEHAEPDLEDIRPDPREHTSNRSARDATGTNPAHTEASEQALNKYSRTVTQPKSQGGSQAMLYATGLTEDDMNKPQVRIVDFSAACNTVSYVRRCTVELTFTTSCRSAFLPCGGRVTHATCISTT